MASLGHVKDLPKKNLAVDVEGDFTPHYEIIEGKKKLIQEMKQAAKGVDAIYLAADPDREGEAICYHLMEELAPKKTAGGPKIFRVMFNEITANAVKKAFDDPRAVNTNLVDAQQARRVLDRLVRRTSRNQRRRGQGSQPGADGAREAAGAAGLRGVLGFAEWYCGSG